MVENRRSKGYIKKMKEELEFMSNNADTSLINNDMDEFIKLYSRFIEGKDTKIKWEDINPPSEEKIIHYDTLEEPEKKNKKEIINKISILKLNGGLGTTMGLTGPKSAIHVRNEKIF